MNTENENMATTKKKSVKSAKRTVKVAAKPVGKAAQASHAAWTQQSAKLLPFAQGDVSDVTDAARSAAENMMRMSNDAMQQWWHAAQSVAQPESIAAQAKARANDVFGQTASAMMSNFDMAQAQEQVAKAARESAEHFSKSAAACNKAVNEAMGLSKDNAEALVEVANITVALTKELGAELISYSNRSFAQNVELSKQVLACRTLNDMFDLSSRFMKTNLDAFFSESVKLSELLFQASTDVTEPLNERFSASSERLSKVLVA